MARISRPGGCRLASLAAGRSAAPDASPAGHRPLVLEPALITTWVLLRGLTREARHWGSFPDRLRDVSGAAAIVTPDLPGNGTRYRETSPASVAALAAAVRRQIFERGLRPPFHLLGLSLGAMVAIAWADEHPREIAGLVLINTSMRPLNPAWQRLRPSSLLALLRLLLAAGNPARRERLILDLTSRRTADSAALLERWIAWRREAATSSVNALRQLAAAALYRAADRPPVARILVLASLGDALVDPRCSSALAAQWGTDLAVHPDAGHDLPLDDDAWVARQIADWLERPPPDC